jgi:ABC-type Na+ efflux pump permease subunit
MFGGGVWPVVQRELRAAARWPLGPWLRVGGALGGVIVLCSARLDASLSEVGTQLFERVHILLLCLICAIVPALTADCIASERREGTLGLLFLTPLTASGIVVGKTLVQVLRALTVWLAVVPVLTIPFLSGGVTWADLLSFLTIELCAGFLCLAAGILASSLTDNRAIAFILAFVFMGAFVAGSLQYQDWRTVNLTPMQMAGTLSISMIQNGVVVARLAPGVGPIGFGQYRLPARILAQDFIFTAAILLAALRFAGWCVERSWQDKTPSIRRQNWVRRYCSPLFARWFAGSMRRTLEWNPIAWLQQYSWKARLSKWGLCLLFVLLECAVIDGNDPNGLSRLLTILLLILAAAYAFAGVNGFFQEKTNGALELILVTPLSVNQIIFGRIWGLWKQFLPAALLLVGSDIAVYKMIPQFTTFGGYWPPDQDWFWTRDLEIATIYLTLPVVATCFALSARNLLVASAFTVFMVFMPDVVWLMFSSASGSMLQPASQTMSDPMAAWLCVLVVHVWFAMFAYTRLQRNLARRSYSF